MNMLVTVGIPLQPMNLILVKKGPARFQEKVKPSLLVLSWNVKKGKINESLKPFWYIYRQYFL